MARVERGARELAERDGKELVFLDSNVREVAKGVANWTRFHAAGLAGAALAAAPPFAGEVMLASSNWFMEARVYPSNPLLDPKWSSDETEISHEGGPLTRTEKARWLAGDDIALRYVHPCFSATGEEYNCGRCGRCVRAMAAMRGAGIMDVPAFGGPLDLNLVVSQDGTSAPMSGKYRELLWGALTLAPEDVELIDAIRASMIPPKSRIARYRRLLKKSGG